MIVNAANSQLQHGGGVAGALSDAAGPSLQRESNRYVWENGAVSVGKCIATNAGRLDARKVIHAVGPTEKQHAKNPDLIYKVFTNVLEEASMLKAETVAMPLISSGKSFN